LRSQDDKLKISFKISNRNQSPAEGICCRHHNKLLIILTPQKRGKTKEKRGKNKGKKERKKFVAEFFAWKVSQFFKKEKKLMRFGD
jgi:hypothetical protein